MRALPQCSRVTVKLSAFRCCHASRLPVHQVQSHVDYMKRPSGRQVVHADVVVWIEPRKPWDDYVDLRCRNIQRRPRISVEQHLHPGEDIIYAAARVELEAG